MSRRQHPTTGTAGGVHHERESFREDWSIAKDILKKKIYRGDIPLNDSSLLAQWYEIRKAYLNEKDKKMFEEKKDLFDASLSDELSGQLANAMRFISEYLSNDGSS